MKRVCPHLYSCKYTLTMTTRTNQRQRTRSAIVDAARTLIGGGADLTMASVAKAALVSEATAYRYFPDLVSLLDEALLTVRPDLADALTSIADSDDPVERVARATEALLREVLANQRAVRVIMAASIARPESAGKRPVRRFDLIDAALAELSEADLPAARTAQLKRDLAVVMSAEALFILTDLCGLAAEDAVASVVRTARTLTAAALPDAASP
jgi:AcrR family transcriptional regulator